MTSRAPIHPWIVLAVAILLPGMGHVVAGYPQRGLGFACFALLLLAFTWVTTTPAQSFVGRAAGGLFVWAVSIPDAYRLARINYERWKMQNRDAAAG